VNSLLINNIKRFFLLVLLQVLILKQIHISWEGFDYIHLYIYPLFIILLPLKIQRPLLLIIAFITGLIIDMFYDSPGLHTSALVLTAYLRDYVLKFLEPRDGYNIDTTPSIYNFGFNWFIIYSSILVFINIFWYFSVEAFSFQYISDIILKTIFSFIFSEIIILLYVIILNPK